EAPTAPAGAHRALPPSAPVERARPGPDGTELGARPHGPAAVSRAIHHPPAASRAAPVARHAHPAGEPARKATTRPSIAAVPRVKPAGASTRTHAERRAWLVWARSSPS